MSKTVKTLSLILAVLMLIPLASCTDAPATATVSPKTTVSPETTAPATTATPETTAEKIIPEGIADGATDVRIAPQLMLDFMNAKSTRKAVMEFAQGTENIYMPETITLSWEDTGADEYTVALIEEGNPITAAWTRVTSEPYTTFTNLKSGTKYTWSVSADGKAVTGIRTFETAAGQPRPLFIDGVVNSRDIGGFVTEDGKYRIKQGMVYRSAKLDNITEAGADVLVNELGLKTEIDLRDPDDGDTYFSPLLETRGVSYLNFPVVGYSSVFNMNESHDRGREAVRAAFSAMADPDNYPLLFHCAIGTDRTGTLAALLESLLGLPQESVVRDYQLTWFFALNPGEDDDRFVTFNDFYFNIKKSKFNGNSKAKPTAAENIAEYLLSIGVTQEEIDSIRSILLEEIK